MILGFVVMMMMLISGYFINEYVRGKKVCTSILPELELNTDLDIDETADQMDEGEYADLGITGENGGQWVYQNPGEGELDVDDWKLDVYG